jgi:hypothetical protein
MEKHYDNKKKYQRINDSYQNIRNCTLLTTKILNDNNIKEFQDLLNKAQPLNDKEYNQREIIQFLYRKTKGNFCRYLSTSKLNSFILWTEARSIVMHFRIRGIIYIKWDGNKYVCNIHKGMMNTGKDQPHNNTQKQHNNKSGYTLSNIQLDSQNITCDNIDNNSLQPTTLEKIVNKDDI